MSNDLIKPTNGHDRLAAQDLIHAMGSGNKAHTFVKPGRDALELLMRTVFTNERQARQVVMLYSKLVKYQFQDGIDDLRALMAANCSIKGRSRMEALMAEIQVLAPSLYGGAMDDKSLRNYQKERKKHENGDNNGATR